MRVYTVYLRPGDATADTDFVLVRDGFCWPAFFLSVLWALWHRLWLVAVFLGVVSVVLETLAQGLGLPGQAAVTLGLAVAVGYLASDLRGWTLGRKGYEQVMVVTGGDLADAERRYLESVGSLGMGAP